ncbi:MAG: efflux RND transporter permease subunit [bacterium]
MERVVRFAVQRPVTVSMATIAAIVFGLVALGRLDLKLLPDIRYPSVTIQTDFPNTAPLDVENLVTRPIEEAVGVVPGLRKVHSISQAGLSQVTLEFGWDTDMDYAALEVREKVDLLSMPEDARTPVLLKYDPALDPVLRIGVAGSAPLVQLRSLSEDVLKKELESLQGVAAAKVNGGLEEEIRVEVDEARLAALGIPIADVNAAIAQENVNASGGRLRDRNAEYLVRTLSRFEDVDSILDVTVAVRDGQPIRLADVATVSRGHKERTEITHVDGREAVEIAIYKEGDANVVEVARRVKAHLDRIAKALPSGIETKILFDQSVFIAQAVNEVRNNAILGGLLAIVILFAFLRDFRSTLVIALAIPISIVATFILMYSRGISLNVMSLGGLALGVGMLVDNSIVVLESIARKREENAAAGDRTDDAEAVVRGTGEVAGAVTASTLTTVAVFAPIVFVVEGVTGQIFRDQALTVTFSLLVSLLVALTVTPMILALGRRRRAAVTAGPAEWRDLVSPGGHARWFRVAAAAVFVAFPAAAIRAVGRLFSAIGGLFGRSLARPLAGFERGFDLVTRTYARLLDASLRRRGLVLGSVAIMVAVSAVVLARLGTELIPPLSQGELTLAIELPEGTPLSRTDAVSAELGRALRKIDGVALVSANVGISSDGGGTVPRRKENTADLHLALATADHETEDRVLEGVRDVFAHHPDVSMKVGRPSLLSFSTPLEVDVFGWELGALGETADQVAAEVARLRGARDVRVSLVPGSPEIRIAFDRDKLNRLGLRLSDVAAVLQDKVRGEVATRYRDRERHIDIRVQNREDQRTTLTAVRDLIVAERDGVPIRLGTIASMDVEQGPAEIHRLGRKRVAIVQANLAGRDLGSATTELASRLTQIPLPAGVSVELGGQNDEMTRSFRSLQLAILLAVFLVYLVMASQFESFLYPFLIMFTVPLALMGAILGLWVTGTPLSVIAAIGAIMLAGIVVNNGIVLVDRINQLRRRSRPLREAVLEAGAERLRPIVMTTATTILGLLPMALGLGEGAELRAPLAVTVIAGLLTATVLTLLVVPVTYTLLTPGDDGAVHAERRGRIGDALPSPGAGGR